MAKISLIVGLGNPGEKYKGTRHNLGFELVDLFAKEKWQKKFNSEMSELDYEGRRIRLLKPMTYMNLSGKAVKQACSYYKIPVKEVLVLHDDTDLPCGKLRIKQGGGDAGHNGLVSVTESLDSPGYYRLRLGVGRSEGEIELANWVLGKVTKQEKKNIDPMLDRGKVLVFDLLDSELLEVQNKYN